MFWELGGDVMRCRIRELNNVISDLSNLFSTDCVFEFLRFAEKVESFFCDRIDQSLIYPMINNVKETPFFTSLVNFLYQPIVTKQSRLGFYQTTYVNYWNRRVCVRVVHFVCQFVNTEG